MKSKKLLSLLCAISMIGTMFTSFVVRAAEPSIALTVNVTDTDTILGEDTDPDYEYEDLWGQNIYKVELSISGVSPKTVLKDEAGNTLRDENNKVLRTGALAYGVQSFIIFDNDKFSFINGTSPLPGATCGAAGSELTFAWTTATEADYVKENKVIATWTLVADKFTEESEFKLSDLGLASETFVELDFYDNANAATQVKASATAAANVVPLTFNGFVLNKAEAPVLADFTDLNTAIAAAEAVEADKYVSVEAVNAALAAAKAIDQAAETDQAKVNAAAKAINDAIAALELKPVPSVNAEKGEVKYGDSSFPGKKTAGFATTVTPANGGAFTKLTANIGNGSIDKDFVIYNGVSIKATTVFGLNITQVPEDVEITVNSVKAE